MAKWSENGTESKELVLLGSKSFCAFDRSYDAQLIL